MIQADIEIPARFHPLFNALIDMGASGLALYYALLNMNMLKLDFKQRIMNINFSPKDRLSITLILEFDKILLRALCKAYKDTFTIVLSEG